MKTLKTFFCSSQRNLAKLVKVLKSFQLASLQLLDYAELLLKKMFTSGYVSQTTGRWSSAQCL